MFCTDEEHFNYLITERYRETLSFTVTLVIEGSTRKVLVREMKIHFLWNRCRDLVFCQLFMIFFNPVK